MWSDCTQAEHTWEAKPCQRRKATLLALSTPSPPLPNPTSGLPGLTGQLAHGCSSGLVVGGDQRACLEVSQVNFFNFPSICMAAGPGHLPDLTLLATFAVGSFVMRGAGCTINDMWDRNIDNKVLVCLLSYRSPLVARWSGREIVRSRQVKFQCLTPSSSLEVSLAWVSLFSCSLTGKWHFVALRICLAILINRYSVLLGAASMGLVVTYPVMKRFTYYPQFVLGLAFNWG